jgi:hypothetical protein
VMKFPSGGNFTCRRVRWVAFSSCGSVGCSCFLPEGHQQVQKTPSYTGHALFVRKRSMCEATPGIIEFVLIM